MGYIFAIVPRKFVVVYVLCKKSNIILKTSVLSIIYLQEFLADVGLS